VAAPAPDAGSGTKEGKDGKEGKRRGLFRR
jgi:hypothetical protein